MLSTLGITQQEIARRCRRSRAAVGHWMTGFCRPDGDMRALLLSAYKIPIEAWIEQAGPPVALPPR